MGPPPPGKHRATPKYSTGTRSVPEETSIMSDRLVSVKALASHLGVPTGWVYAKKDRLPHVRVGKYIRFDINEVLRVLRGEAEEGKSNG